MSKKASAAKWAVYIALLYIALSLQTALFSRLPILGAAPSLAPCLVAAVALYEGRGSMWFALFCGVFSDCLFGGGGSYTLLLTLLALAVSSAASSFLGRSWLSAVLTSVVSVFSVELVRFFIRLALGRALFSALWTALLPRTLYSALVSLALSLAVRGVSLLFCQSCRETRYGR